MTHAGTDLSLSSQELVVLARLSSSKPPQPNDLTRAVLELAPPVGSAERARETTAETLVALRLRALVDARRMKLTEDGKRALCVAMGLERPPTWSQVRVQLAACGLGLRPGSEEARKALKTDAMIGLAVLQERGALPQGASLTAVCNALIAEVLGMPPGPVTLQRIQAHVLSQRLGIASKDKPQQVAPAILHDSRADKKSMMRALGRRWLAERNDPAHGGRTVPASAATLASAALPHLSGVPPLSPRFSLPPGDQTLLALVREALPRIGSDGRFGAEKVFVSAIWHDISRDRRASNLSLDHFKCWLVTANRDQLLDLARADLVGAMDAQLVAESEIEDLGATFHFVLDHHAGATASGLGHHVR